MLVMHMLFWLNDNFPPPPISFMIISGDGGYSTVMNQLTRRGYDVILAYPFATSEDLLKEAKFCWSWSDLLRAEYGKVRGPDPIQVPREAAFYRTDKATGVYTKSIRNPSTPLKIGSTLSKNDDVVGGSRAKRMRLIPQPSVSPTMPIWTPKKRIDSAGGTSFALTQSAPPRFLANAEPRTMTEAIGDSAIGTTSVAGKAHVESEQNELMGVKKSLRPKLSRTGTSVERSETMVETLSGTFESLNLGTEKMPVDGKDNVYVPARSPDSLISAIKSAVRSLKMKEIDSTAEEIKKIVINSRTTFIERDYDIYFERATCKGLIVKKFHNGKEVYNVREDIE